MSDRALLLLDPPLHDEANPLPAIVVPLSPLRPVFPPFSIQLSETYSPRVESKEDFLVDTGNVVSVVFLALAEPGTLIFCLFEILSVQFSILGIRTESFGEQQIQFSRLVLFLGLF